MRMNNTTTIGIVLATVLIAGGLIGYEQHKVSQQEADALATANANTKNLPLAQCLAEKGAKFYGAEWCPHCRDQKLAFAIPGYKDGTLGDTAAHTVNDASPVVAALPYVECAIPDGKGGYEQDLPQVCKDANIESFPTWVFTDGSRLSGNVPLATLAEKTGCTVPQ